MSTVLPQQQLDACTSAVTAYYQQHKRSMPWRDKTDPYYVLVSEIMLQQTQVDRVRPKFEAFIQQFPTITVLARSPLSEVLKVWSGLGYNRRAKFLHLAAKEIVAKHGGLVPNELQALIALPGIGPNTAGAILAYAFNQPVIFIETNIRTVYLHHFFQDKHAVSDAELRPLIEATLDRQNPREWYWALMDYGSYLKGRGLGAISSSKHYAKQSSFQGSLRQLRGQIVKHLANNAETAESLTMVLTDERVPVALHSLLGEGLIEKEHGQYKLPEH
jgi:A/G-specific adenine glycosylase